MRNPGDARLRELERLAAAGDHRARRALIQERRRRGLPDRTWHGAIKLARAGRRVGLSREAREVEEHLVGYIENAIEDREDDPENWNHYYSDSHLVDVAAGAYADNAHDGSEREDPILGHLPEPILQSLIEQARDRIRRYYNARGERLHPPTRPNPDEDLRALERAASLGDPRAREALRNARVRAGVASLEERVVASLPVEARYLYDTHTGPAMGGVWKPGRRPPAKAFRALRPDLDFAVRERWLRGIDYDRAGLRFAVDHFLGGSSPGQPPVVWERLWIKELRHPRRGGPAVPAFWGMTSSLGQYSSLLA